MKRPVAGAFALAALAGTCACSNVSRSTVLPSPVVTGGTSARKAEARTSHWSVIPVSATQPLWELVVGRDHAVWATSTQPPGLYRVAGSGQPTFQPLNNFEPQTFGLGIGAHLWIVSG